MTSRPPIGTIVVLTFLLTACGSTSFKAGDGKSAKSRKEAPKQGEAAQKPAQHRDADNHKAPGNLGAEEEEEQPSDKPAQVSGAFLVCARLIAPEKADAAQESYGCRIEKAGLMADISRASVLWDVLEKATGDSAKAGTTMAQLKSGAWHVELGFPTGAAKGKAVSVVVDWGESGEPETLEAALDGGPVALRFGKDYDFHLGNDDFSGTTCHAQVRALPLAGTTITVPFEVKDKAAAVSVSLGDICGMDYANGLRIVQDQTVVKELTLGKGITAVSLPQVTLPPGKYAIEISSFTNRGDADDFVIGDIFVVTGAGKVVAGKPSAK